MYKSSGLSKWTAAVMKAREEMGVTGFMVRRARIFNSGEVPDLSFRRP